LQTEYPPILAIDIVNARYIEPFRYYESGSPFEYNLVRFLYTKKREVEIGEDFFTSNWLLHLGEQSVAPAEPEERHWP
jgi:hypothetical protein